MSSQKSIKLLRKKSCESAYRLEVVSVRASRLGIIFETNPDRIWKVGARNAYNAVSLQNSKITQNGKFEVPILGVNYS
jgi:hypothetical protein